MMRSRRHALQLMLTAALPGAWLATSRAQESTDAFKNISQQDAGAAVRAALEQGALAAVQLLGQTNGFWSNNQVRVHLPEWLQRAESALRVIGRGAELDELELAMNRAAEQAVPQARQVLVNAVRGMTVQDAKRLLTEGEQSVTEFFADKTRKPLTGKLLPIVTRVTEKMGLAKQYNQLAAQGERLGLVRNEQANLERYVTGKALDGLYLMIGEEEKKIRQDPLNAASAIIKKVFGALQ